MNIPTEVICRISLLLVAFLGTANAVAADAPQVLELFPKNNAVDVDPDIKQMRVTFDRDMITGRWSLCGGGPSFPEVQGQPRWKNKRTLIVRVSLKPDHDYSLSLNCPVGQKFQSADGTPLVPLPWHFSTASKAPKLSKAQQKKLNAQSLKQLTKLLRDNYSYYDRRNIDWAAQPGPDLGSRGHEDRQPDAGRSRKAASEGRVDGRRGCARQGRPVHRLQWFG